MSLLFKKKRKRAWRGRQRKNKFVFSNRKRRNLVKTLKITIVVVAVFFIFYFLFCSGFFLMEEIKINGNRSINSENIENIALAEMSGMRFGFLPENNFIFDQNEEIKTILLNKFSEIKEVEIKKSFPNIMEVKIIEKDPTIIWCRFNDCYYIDTNGKVFRSASDISQKDNSKKIIKIIEEKIIAEEKVLEDENKIETSEEEIMVEENENNNRDSSDSDDLKNSPNSPLRKGEQSENESEPENKNKEESVLLPIKINDEVADNNFINFALDVDREISYNAGLKIKFYKTKGTNTRELIAYTDKNIRLYFNATEEADQQVKYLKDFLAKGIDKNEIDNLEYIYLSSGNKIFYK